MDLTIGFSYPQSFKGPFAPHSTATKLFAPPIPLAIAAKVCEQSLSSNPPAKNIAVLDCEQLVSPPGITLCLLQIFTISSHMNSISMLPKTPIPNSIALGSPLEIP